MCGLNVSSRCSAQPVRDSRIATSSLILSDTSLKGLRRQPVRNTNFLKKTGHLVYGSRIDSLKPLSIPLSKYMTTDRLPTLMSAVKVIPGMSRKLAGTFLNTSLSIEHLAL
jgi:hypothetical protein